ncbi:MAG: TIGR04211 family SH3 domain-containing protein [Gammaproteobacteria bacterium]|nr:TIGR04211 family SH3 domain-containing protein [Gammaproteobacteria bacterium]
MSIKILISLLAVLWINTLQAQETEDNKQVRYVTDQLRLSLYQQADSQSKVIQLLSSGDKLVVEEIAGPYAKVVTPAGNRGWVKRGFLVSDPTAGLLLKDLEQQNELLKRELEKLNDSKIVIDQYEKDMDNMSQTIDNLETEKLTVEQTVVELKQQAEEKLQQEKAKPALASLIKIGRIYWHYILLVMFGVMLIGFIIGKQITESSIKKKFHGIKVW